eukprot:420922_1
MKLSRFAKLSVLVVLLTSAAIGVNGECSEFGSVPHATLDTNGATSKTAATVTCDGGFLYNKDGYLGTTPKKFTCPTNGKGTAGWVPKREDLACVKGNVPATAKTGHWASDAAISFVVGGLLVGGIGFFVMKKMASSA